MQNINLHSFRITCGSVTNFISFEILVSAFLICFISPAIPYYDGFHSDLNLGAFTLTAAGNTLESEKRTGLVFVFALKSSNYFYFFLFRCNLHISAFQSDIFPINSSQHDLFLHDKFFSFQQFCYMNDLIIEPLFFKESEDFDEDEQVYKITRQPFYYYFPCHNEKQESCYYIFTTLFTHIVQSQQPFSGSLFWSNILPIYTHYSLTTSALSSHFKFEIVNRCYLQNKILVWSQQPLNEYFHKQTNLQIKSFVLFSEYCRSSQRDVVMGGEKKIVFEEKPIIIFNLKLWFDLAIRFGWFSVGGFLKLNSCDYVTEIYNFMQYN